MILHTYILTTNCIAISSTLGAQLNPFSGHMHLLAKKGAAAVWPFKGIEIVVARHRITHLQQNSAKLKSKKPMDINYPAI